jgi:hypothetical protein
MCGRSRRDSAGSSALRQSSPKPRASAVSIAGRAWRALRTTTATPTVVSSAIPAAIHPTGEAMSPCAKASSVESASQ